jgi:hypothetical protein
MQELTAAEPRHIALLSMTPSLTESNMMMIAGVCADQLRNEAAPVWNEPAPRVKFFEHDSQVPDGWWPVYGWQHTDAPGAAGYHDLNPAGVPFASIFVDDALATGSKILTGPESVSSIFSHECIEAFLNAFLNRWQLGPDGALWAVEGCDAVQANTYPHAETGITLSAFVYPSYFKADAPGPYDRLGTLTKPFSIAPGGYAIRKVDGVISNIFGNEVPDRKRNKHESSRTKRIERAA